MLYDLLQKLGKDFPIKGIALVTVFLTGFVLTFICLRVFRKLLPKDQGREFAVNGSLSEGKARGAGLIFVTCFVFLTALFIPLNVELVLYMVFIYLAMLSGYFDDAAEVPWGNLKKGLIDLVVSCGIGYTYYHFNSSDITVGLFNWHIHIPPVLFVILASALVWASINVTNCADGVDGLCATLCIVSIMLLGRLLDSSNMMSMCIIMIGVLAAYLWFNASPSTMLMGDAGSRALGVFLALLALKSNMPIAYIPLCIMLIIDGGLGLIKVSFIRFLKLKGFMKNIRTPIHDHVRKNKGWSDTQVVLRFVIIQTVIGVCYHLGGM